MTPRLVVQLFPSDPVIPSPILGGKVPQAFDVLIAMFGHQQALN